MATIEQNGTKFSFSVLPLGLLSTGVYAKIEMKLNNEFIAYRHVYENMTREDIERWIFSMFRLLAGGYRTEQNLSFEKTGFAVDLSPYVVEGKELSREELRSHDCVMAIRFLMCHKKTLLGGVYSLILHREDIEKFAIALREEFYNAYAKFEKKKGKYLFVGVSPQGYQGCNYWYIDRTKTAKAGDFVWVCMGRRNLRQIVYVDRVRCFDDDTAPCNVDTARAIQGKATDEEVQKWKTELLKVGRKI